QKCDFLAFEKFIKRHTEFIVKPPEGSHGKGIRFIQSREIKNVEVLFEKMQKEKVLLEEKIIQHEKLSEFNPTSVNTLRVVTLLLPNDKVRVMTANLRMGNGPKYADNFHHDGIASLIDIETGIVVTGGIDRDFRRYI